MIYANQYTEQERTRLAQALFTSEAWLLIPLIFYQAREDAINCLSSPIYNEAHSHALATLQNLEQLKASIRVTAQDAGIKSDPFPVVVPAE